MDISTIDFMSLMHSIPDVVWSGIIASVLTLSGVLISNWSNTTRLMIQLQHSANESAKARIEAIRREVYLYASGEITKAIDNLSSVANESPSELAIRYQEFYNASAKLQLVAEPATALLISKFTEEFTTVSVTALKVTIPLQLKKAKLESLLKSFNDEITETKRVVAEMTKLHESANWTEKIFNALNQSFETHTNQAKKYSESYETLNQEYDTEKAEFLRNFSKDTSRAHRLHLEVKIALRRDLGLVDGLADLKDRLEEQSALMGDLMNNTLNELQSVLKKP